MRLGVKCTRELLELVRRLPLPLANDAFHLSAGLVERVAASLVFVHGRA